MKPVYDDILSRIDIPPIWFDENAVPRYCEFAPSEAASIYVSEVALAEITCQGCGHLFRVAFSYVNMGSKSIAEAIRAKTLDYGDPPNIRCCLGGPTMSSEPRRLVEYWHRHHREYVEDGKVTNGTEYFRWRREPSLEIDIEPDWVTG
ncbi:hypothetical protein [Sinorhizobium fredii]|uniref:hypothetical protein n=1 Tax=Rhizobium fredii TaxID=380 RepID=UPI003515EF47